MQETDAPSRLPNSLDQAANPKRRQILEGARHVFLAQGFDRASMDEIARASGVSKGTLYVYFHNKEALFQSLILIDRVEQAERLFELNPDDLDIRGVLTRLGVSMLEIVHRPSTIAMLRVAIAAADQFPNIGRTVYEAGPGVGIQRLAEYFESMNASGIVTMEDPRLAAVQFLDLCQVGVTKPLLYRVVDEISEDKRHYIVESAVEMMLARYAAPPIGRNARASA